MKLKSLLALFLLLFLSSHLFSQRSCGTEAFMQQSMQDPAFKTNHDALQARFQERLNDITNNPQSNRLTTLIIPVAVHFPEANVADRACLEGLAQNQVDILNADFRGENTDISNWTAASSEYPGINTGMLDVQFQLATVNHPSGSGLTEGNVAVTVGYNFGGGGDFDTNWAGYMNFIIKNLGGMTLGYSALGGSPSSGGGVVMNTFAFGSGSGCSGYVPGAPFHLGRTVTHELGHFLNLDHTWGGGGCASDDNVTDTPNISTSTGGCPTAGSVIMCGNKSLTMNFMDYVNDACMYMLTEGQTTRAQAYLDVIYNQYLTNVLSVDSVEFENALSIAPNPVIGNELNLKTPNNILEDNSKIEIFDLQGKRIISTKLNRSLSEQSIDVSTLKNGLYIVQIRSGKNTSSKKVIIGK